MILLNFSHPLTPAHLEAIARLTQQPVDNPAGELQVINLAVHFEASQGFDAQLNELLRGIPLTAEDWQTRQIIVNPPSLNYITALLLAELHGRMGYFPPVIRLAPVPGSLPPVYDVAEVLNLQARRDAARKTRY